MIFFSKTGTEAMFHHMWACESSVEIHKYPITEDQDPWLSDIPDQRKLKWELCH